MKTADKVISIAEEQVGYLEKASPYDLDSKTGNAGYNNYTKFARDLASWVGSPFVNGYAWCLTYCVWCEVKAFGIETAKKLLGGWTAYCPTQVEYFKEMGRWFSTPQIGDFIFFYDSTHDYGHVGLVYEVDASTVYTIEGNTSSASGVVPNGGGVYRKSYAIDYSRIAGYGRPKYDTEDWIKGSKGWRYGCGKDVERNTWKTIDGKDYYFKANGYMATDEFIKSSAYKMNGILYYVDKDGVWNGHTYGWKQNSKGYWLENLENGKFPTSRWCVIDGKTYYFDKDGYMVTGKRIINGKEYVFNEDGSLKK